ncbi:MAG TPA: metallopeptidase TldD-related protein [Candidatus Sabulitectum sp.]|nr:metallopeptidase TldD-related protein [Candidatus Sabulitectum sp.]
MEKLLEMARARGCRAETYSIRARNLGMSKVNGAVSDVSASIQSGVSLRIIKDGKTGMAYTKNLMDREELLANAMDSLAAGVQADYDFPASGEMEHTEEYDPSVEDMNYDSLSEQIAGLEPLYRKMKGGVLNLHAGTGVTEIEIRNTSGARLLHRDSDVYCMANMLYPGTATGLRNIFQARSKPVIHIPDATRTVAFFNDSLPEIEVREGRMKVVLMPEVMYAFTWRLGSASSGKAFHDKVSPLLEKKGKQVISPMLSLVSDPATGETGTRLFDDEGVPARAVPIFRDGIFTSVYNNLDYAAKLGEEPTGTGFRGGMWGGEPVSIAPSPSLSFARFSTGGAAFQEMLSMIDRGIIVFGALGAHSGNILNGDLSIGLSPGIYVENGKVKGRVKDGMVAGNVYEMLSRTIAVENSSHYTGSSYENPAILLDDISVVGS